MRLNSDPEVRNESLPGHLSKRLVPSLFALFALIVAVIPFLWRLFLPGTHYFPCQGQLSAYFPGSLCQRRLQDAKRRKQWRNALKSLGRGRFSGAKLESVIFLCQKAVSANDNWRRSRSWIRPTKHGSKTICRLLRQHTATHLLRKISGLTRRVRSGSRK
jgi:hypothetical protein